MIPRFSGPGQVAGDSHSGPDLPTVCGAINDTRRQDKTGAAELVTRAAGDMAASPFRQSDA